MTLAATLVAVALGLPLLAAAGYLALLTIFSFGASKAPAGPVPQLRYWLVVPAHDEEAGIARTVKNLLALDYSAELWRLWVVADNCHDGTATAARAAGAEVLVRDDPERRGKGYALALAFDRCLAEGGADAVVVVDADTLAQPNLLRALNGGFAAGAEVLQAHYGVLAAASAWRTRLLKLSFALFHGVRSTARERLGLSCGLRGNGMAFKVDVLRRVPHRAFSVVEDLEYGLDLGAAGVRVGYVDTTEVLGEMPATEAASRSQRARWEGGRAQLRRRVPGLLMQALRQRNWMLADLAVDLALPPLATLVAGATLGSASVGVGLWAGWIDRLAAVPWLLADVALVAYVLRGWAISHAGLRGLLDLAWAPVFVSWKLFRRGSRQRPSEWVRTTRARPIDPQIPR